jgi:hypothetical protein
MKQKKGKRAKTPKKKPKKSSSWKPNAYDCRSFRPDFWVALERVEPLHEVRSTPKFLALVRSFKKFKWQGRPLLVESVGLAGWLSWTGSHRIAAALAAGIKQVPVILLNKRAYVRVHGRPKRSYLSETVEDEERLGRLLECGDERAARLMARECGLSPLDLEHILREPRRQTGGPPRASSPRDR